MYNKVALYVLGSCGIAITTFSLSWLFFILFKYIIRLRIRSRYVLCFYCMSTILLLLILTQFTYNLSTIHLHKRVELDININKPVKPVMNNLLDSSIKLATASVGYCVVATMHKLSISLQYSFGEISYQQKQNR